jgi:hypothetical protein
VIAAWRRIGLPVAELNKLTILSGHRATVGSTINDGISVLDGSVVAARNLGSVGENRAILSSLGRVGEILAERAQD